MLNKKHLTIKARDFWEKGFGFYHNGKYYRYSTTVNDSVSDRPLPDKETIRGDTIYNAGVMWRDPSDNKIKITQVCQCDFKMEVP